MRVSRLLLLLLPFGLASCFPATPCSLGSDTYKLTSPSSSPGITGQNDLVEVVASSNQDPLYPAPASPGAAVQPGAASSFSIVLSWFDPQDGAFGKTEYSTPFPLTFASADGAGYHYQTHLNFDYYSFPSGFESIGDFASVNLNLAPTEQTGSGACYTSIGSRSLYGVNEFISATPASLTFDASTPATQTVTIEHAALPLQAYVAGQCPGVTVTMSISGNTVSITAYGNGSCAVTVGDQHHLTVSIPFTVTSLG